MNHKQQHGGKRTGAGRKHIYPEGVTKGISVTIPGVLIDGLDDLAHQRGGNRSELITEAVRTLLTKERFQLNVNAHGAID